MRDLINEWRIYWPEELELPLPRNYSLWCVFHLFGGVLETNEEE